MGLYKKENSLLREWKEGEKVGAAVNDPIKAEIISEMRRQGIGYKELGERTGKTRQNVWILLHQKGGLSRTTMEQFARALHMKIETTIVFDGTKEA